MLEKIGQTVADFTLLVNGVTLDGQKLDKRLPRKLEEVYPTEFEQATELEEVPAMASDVVIKAKETVEKPVVYIPVFPGTNSENMIQLKAFEKKVQKSTWYHLSHSTKKLLSSLLTPWLTTSEKLTLSSLPVASQQRMNQMDQLSLSSTSCLMKSACSH